MYILAIFASVLLHPSLQSANVTKASLFKSSSSTKVLLKSEEHLVKQMEDVIANLGNHTDDLKKELNRYVGRYKDMVNEMDSIDDVTAHPINVFHFIKDIVVDWLPIMNLYENTDNQEYVEIVDKLKKFREEAQYPCLDDINSVALSTCSMQRVYELDIVDVIFGNIRDERTNKVFKSFRRMDSWDCLVFGRAALSQHWFNTAVDWMEASQILAENGDTSVETTAINEQLRDAVSKHDSVLLQHGPIGPNWETYSSTIDEELMRQRTDQFGTPEAEVHPSLYTHMDVMELRESRKRLCKGQQLREPQLDDGLICRYLSNDDPYLLIGPFKIEEKSSDPAIIVYHDFFLESETELIKEIARKNLTDSEVVSENVNETRTILGRISRQSVISYSSHPELVSRISHRIEAATKLSTRSQRIHESFKVVNYGIAGHYDTHRDSFQRQDLPNSQNQKLQPDGDRIATFLAYLNDVEAGGATVFNSVGVTIWPRKGSATFWYNLQKSGVPDEFTLHSGCPVLYGEKWILTQWQLADPQLFIAPCGLHECDKYTLP